jgi:hypothetical protein
MTGTATLWTGARPIAPSNVPECACPWITMLGSCRTSGAASRSLPRNAAVPGASFAIVVSVGAYD